MTANPKILLIADEGPLREQIESLLHAYTNTESITAREVKLEIDRIGPDIVLLLQPEDGTEAEILHHVNLEGSAQISYFLSQDHDFVTLRDTIRAGIHDFFILPDEVSQFQDRLQKSVSVLQSKSEKTEENAQPKSAQPIRRGTGQVYSFFSGKGGAGKTLSAVTYAQTMQLDSMADVILIDLNLHYGGIETFLGIESNRSLIELQPVIEELNENHIRNVTEKEKHSQMEILLSPRDAEQAETVTDSHISRLIRACRRSFDFVIIDLPVEINANSYAALEQSDMIYYIMNMDTVSIRVYNHVEELFRRLGMNTENRLELVINFKDSINELQTNDIKSFLHVPIAAELRRDLKGVQPFVNKGEPLRKTANDKKLVPFAKDIRKWVRKQLK